MKYSAASSSLSMSMKHFWMVESHSLILVSWKKGISHPVTCMQCSFLRDLHNRMTS